MQKVLIIDNYDSFTFNLVHYLEDLNAAVTVFRNDEFELQEIEAFDKIILSPGPGIPDEAGLLKDVIKTFAPTKSILGVCLGHQAIAEVFNSDLINLQSTLHGISSKVTILDKTETFSLIEPSFVNFTAFERRLIKICLILTISVQIYLGTS